MWRFFKEGEGKMWKNSAWGVSDSDFCSTVFDFKSLMSSHTTKTPLQDKLLFLVDTRSRIQPDALSLKQWILWSKWAYHASMWYVNWITDFWLVAAIDDVNGDAVIVGGGLWPFHCLGIMCDGSSFSDRHMSFNITAHCPARTLMHARNIPFLLIIGFSFHLLFMPPHVQTLQTCIWCPLDWGGQQYIWTVLRWGSRKATHWNKL